MRNKWKIDGEPVSEHKVRMRAVKEGIEIDKNKRIWEIRFSQCVAFLMKKNVDIESKTEDE